MAALAENLKEFFQKTFLFLQFFPEIKKFFKIFLLKNEKLHITCCIITNYKFCI